MLKGMEEFLYKNASVINFGEKKSVEENLLMAIVAKDSYNYKVFHANLGKMIEEHGSSLTGSQIKNKSQERKDMLNPVKLAKQRESDKVPSSMRLTVARAMKLQNQVPNSPMNKMASETITFADLK